jgi:hypothetical protein
MKLLLPLLLLSSFAIADIEIIAPTEYDNGEPLLITDIEKYIICVSESEEYVCNSEIEVAGNVIDTSLLPTNTHHIRAKTVTVTGSVGEYGPMFTDAFRKPLAPGLKIKIIIEVQ